MTYSIGADQYPSVNSFGDPGGIHPPEVNIVQVQKNLNPDYACKIIFTITDQDPLDKCAIYIYPECLFSTDVGKTWRTMTPWNRSNPKGVHPDWTFEALPIGSSLFNTFVWDVASDLPCPESLENVLIQIVVTDGKFNSSPVIVATDDFIDIIYSHPEGNKIHVGYRVFSSQGGGICVESFEWSRDGSQWSPMTVDLDDPMHSENPITSNVENIAVWDFTKDTTDPNDTCVKISTIRPGDANPVQTGVNMEDLDEIYHNGAAVYFQGKLYAAFGVIDEYSSNPNDVATYNRINSTGGRKNVDTFMILDLESGTVDYRHHDVNFTDFNGNLMWNGSDPFFSHPSHYIDRVNGRWYFWRGTGALLQISYYEFSTGRWRIMFSGNTPGGWPLRQSAYWDHDGWWYIFGGYRGGVQLATKYFLRINTNELTNGNIVVEFLEDTASGSGTLNGSIGSIQWSSNPVTNIDVDNPARWDVRGRIIPGQDGNALVVGGVPGSPLRDNFVLFNRRNFTIEQGPLPVNDIVANYELLDQNGAIVLIGGQSGGSFMTGPITVNNTVWLYNPCVKRFIVYQNISGFEPRERTFVAQNPETEKYYVFGGRGQFTNDTVYKLNEWDLITPEVFTNQVECPVFFTHGNVWEFGPGAEYNSPQNAFRGMINFYKGEPIPGDQIITGSPDRIYRGSINLNDIWYEINNAGNEIIFTSTDPNNRVRMSPSIEMNKSLIEKYEDENILVWESREPRCIEDIVDSLWIYENGTPLNYVNSLTEVNDNPGSFYFDPMIGSVFIHATDSSFVRSNGKSYTISAFRSVLSYVNPSQRIKNFVITDVDFEEFSLLNTSDNNAVIELDTAVEDFSLLNCRFNGNGAILKNNNSIGLSIIKSNLAKVRSCEAFSIISESGVNSILEGNVILGNCSQATGLSISASNRSDIARNAVDAARNPLSVTAVESEIQKNIIRGFTAPSNGCMIEVDSLNSLVYGNAIMRFHPGDIALRNLSPIVFKNNTLIAARSAVFSSEPIVDNQSSLIFERNLLWLNDWCIVYSSTPDGMSTSDRNVVFHGQSFGWEFPLDSWPLDQNSRLIENEDPIVSGYSDVKPIHQVSVFTDHSLAKRIQDADTVHDLTYDIMDSLNQCPLDAGCSQSPNNRTSFRVKQVSSSRWPPKWMDIIDQNKTFSYEKFRTDLSQYRNLTSSECSQDDPPVGPP